MKHFEDFLLASHEPITEAERGWIDVLRAICPGGVPAPDLRSVHALRSAILGTHAAESQNQ